IALLALASRLFGDLLGSQTAQGFFPSLTRLSYPVEYWNGLAILTGLAVPLLLLFATTATSALWRALAVLPFPALSAVVYLTSSRGGAATGALGALVFLLISHRRMQTAAAIAFAALGSALAI